MGLIESISRGGWSFRADAGGTPAPWDDYWYNPLGKASASGMRVDATSAKQLATVIACVGAKGRAMGTMPCKIYTDIPGGGKRVVTNHSIYDLLYYQPNSLQTAYEFKQMMQGHVELRGNAYAEILPGPRGAVDQLLPLHPDHVKVEVIKSSGRLRYIYNDPLTSATRVLLQEEVFHLRDFCDNSAVGQSRISMGMDVLGVALAQQDYAARFLKNDAKSSMAITGTAFRDKEDEDRFRKSFQSSQTGSNRGRIIMLPAGLDIKEMSVKPIDAQLLESRRASQIEICTLFNVLPHLVGVDAGKSATYASVEQFNIMHAVQCVLPMAVMWEQAIQRDLILDDRYFAKFSLASLLRGDTASRFAAYAVAIANGWMCQDDVRELEDLNPIPNGEGKTFWRPLNWAPLRQIANPTPALPPGKKVDPEAEVDDQDVEEGAGTDPGEQSAQHGRLKLLAASSSERCVRKEVLAVKKMIEHKADFPEIWDFYRAHTRFTTEVLHLESNAALNVMMANDSKSRELATLIEEEQLAEASAWVMKVSVEEPLRLATIAVEGVK
jgi:HK97 family phage portal protein